MARLNTQWHDRHRMPPGATMDQRIEWHLAHVRACGCRAIPPAVVAEIERRGLSVPKARAGKTIR